jgi:hypothetical protein
LAGTLPDCHVLSYDRRTNVYLNQMKIFLLGTTLVSSTVFVGLAQPASALCLTSNSENNCSTFSGTTLSQVTQTYNSLNLQTNTRFQIGFRSSNGGAYTVNNLSYSNDGTNYTTFAGSFTTSSLFQYGGIQNPFGSTALGRPFYLRYEIQPTVPAGVAIDSLFLANNTGSQTGGVLDFNGGDFQAVERSHQSVPAPLPLLGAAAMFTRLRGLKQKSKRLH